MRRLVLLAPAAVAAAVMSTSAAGAAPAVVHVAELTVSVRKASPGLKAVRMAARSRVPARMGIDLALPSGLRVGWLALPRRTTSIDVRWHGLLEGHRVRDGRYVVRLRVRGRIVAHMPLVIDTQPARLDDLHVDDGAAPFAGDGPLLTTVSPNGDGFRDVANVDFTLDEPATVTMDVTRTVKKPVVLYTVTDQLEPGPHTLTWAPAQTLNPRTYLIRLHTVDALGNAFTYGAPTAKTDRVARGPVVRLQGIDAAFPQTSFLPGDQTALSVATDEPSLTLKVFQSGPEQVVTYADNQLAGVEVDAGAQVIDWSANKSTPGSIPFTIPALPSGLYYVQLGGPDGRIGYAPFVIRPPVLGATSRVLVVLPTNTWQAYNFEDVDGDGYGDTWYAGGSIDTVDLARPYIARGVPPRFYRYDLPFLHWLYWSGKHAEFISDSDFESMTSGSDLAGAYDLIVFEGHEEYVTEHEYDVVQQFRDAGGNLMFLSANNFFWRVDRQGTVLTRIAPWRSQGRPEAALIGVQYRANDDGQRQGVYTVQSTAAEPWLWDGTGLTDGSTFGQYVGGYGIEIDGTTADSPPGTTVVAQIPDLLGPGLTAQMAYYETPAGAKVFAAGVLDFGGSSTFWPVKRMLDNLWARLSVP